MYYVVLFVLYHRVFGISRFFEIFLLLYCSPFLFIIFFLFVALPCENIPCSWVLFFSFISFLFTYQKKKKKRKKRTTFLSLGLQHISLSYFMDKGFCLHCLKRIKTDNSKTRKEKKNVAFENQLLIN
jgi:hypothetical protein